LKRCHGPLTHSDNRRSNENVVRLTNMSSLGDLPCDKEQRTDWQVAAVIDLSEVVAVGGGVGYLLSATEFTTMAAQVGLHMLALNGIWPSWEAESASNH
jgi:hypothetical protein